MILFCRMASQLGSNTWSQQSEDWSHDRSQRDGHHWKGRPTDKQWLNKDRRKDYSTTNKRKNKETIEERNLKRNEFCKWLYESYPVQAQGVCILQCIMYKILFMFLIISTWSIDVQWNLCYNITVMRDHLSNKTTLVGTDLHFYIFVHPIKDHLSYKTTFCWPMEWS